MKRPTVLIVDDTPDNIMLLARLLKERYNTKIATNGSTALQIAQATPDLDLILLDVMMPGLDGYDTCRQLKGNAATAHIPVIFLTAKSQADDEATGLALGAADYLSKPISPPILFARVATQVQLGEARRALAQVESLSREALALLEQAQADAAGAQGTRIVTQIVAEIAQRAARTA
ncbi:MAG: response regulator [Gammaproteobacteria bacterium]